MWFTEAREGLNTALAGPVGRMRHGFVVNERFNMNWSSGLSLAVELGYLIIVLSVLTLAGSGLYDAAIYGRSQWRAWRVRREMARQERERIATMSPADRQREFNRYMSNILDSTIHGLGTDAWYCDAEPVETIRRKHLEGAATASDKAARRIVH